MALLALAPAQSMAAIDPPGHIDNETVQLGVKTDGSLNIYNIDEFGDFFGLRYLPTGNEATSAVSHACEGWGVADTGTQASGYTNFGCDDGTFNMKVESYTRTSTTAVSQVLVCANDGDPLVCKTGDSSLLRVTHDYHPSLDPNLYEATVTIENVGAGTVQPRYRRVVDWQIEPDTSAEALTMSGATSYILRMSNDGYSSADPLSEPLGGCGTHVPPDEACVDPYREMPGAGTFNVGHSPPDDPPTDQGSLFDIALPSLVPGASVRFPLFYGAAGSLALAKSARDAVDADTYALVTPQDQPTTGTPNTFILAFRLAGVTVTNPPPPPPARPTTTNVACSPSSVPVSTPTTCTATVSDTGLGTKTTPTGIVSFTSSASGDFSSSGSCSLSPTATTGEARCSVTYSPSATGNHTITGTYAGDSTHAASSGSTTVTVTTPGGNVDVTAGGGSDTFSPNAVTVSEGNSVTWTNAGGFHNVKFDDDSFTQPSPPNSTSWEVSRTFTAAGTYRYYCEAHGGPGGTGMSGTVVVNPRRPPPVVTLVEPANGALTNDSTPTFSGLAGTASDDLNAITVEIYTGTSASGSPLRTLTTTQSAGAWSVTASLALGDGQYTAQAEQSDAGGNTGMSSANTFQIDSTPPETSITSAPPIATSSTSARFEFSASEAGSSFECRKDEGSWSACTSPWTYSGLTNGSHSFEARSTDPAGNTDSTPALRFWTVDITMPVTPPPDTPPIGALSPAAPSVVGSTGGPGLDTVGPTIRLSARSSQRVLRQGGVVVEVRCVTEACTAQARGTLFIKGTAAKVFKLRRATAQISKGAKARLKLRFTKKVLTVVKRALKKRTRPKARVIATVADFAGNLTTTSRTIRLKK